MLVDQPGISPASLDHVFTPYGNPRVYPGCVRCSKPKPDHPASVPEAISQDQWQVMLDRLGASSVFEGGWRVHPSYTPEPVRREEQAMTEEKQAPEGEQKVQAPKPPEPGKRPAAGRGEAKDARTHEKMEGK
jgi:hypothetical protein